MDIEKLIAEVFIRSPLWDQKDKNHHNRFILDQLWDEVGVKLKTKRDLARNKWKSLRDRFRVVFASIPKTKSGDAANIPVKNQWAYFESLLFLKDQFTPRCSGGNFICEENESLPESNLEPNEDRSVSPQEDVEIISYPSTSAENRSFINIRKRPLTTQNIGSQLLEVEKKKLKYLENKKVQNVEDEDMNFFKSLLPNITNLSPYDKMSYRMQILKVTQEFMIQSTNACTNTNNQNTL